MSDRTTAPLNCQHISRQQRHWSPLNSASCLWSVDCQMQQQQPEHPINDSLHTISRFSCSSFLSLLSSFLFFSSANPFGRRLSSRSFVRRSFILSLVLSFTRSQQQLLSVF